MLSQKPTAIFDPRPRNAEGPAIRRALRVSERKILLPLALLAAALLGRRLLGSGLLARCLLGSLRRFLRRCSLRALLALAATDLTIGALDDELVVVVRTDV